MTLSTPARIRSAMPTGLPRVFWVLFAGLLINAMGTFVLPYLAIYLTRSGISPGAAGAVVACYGLGAVISALVGGELADRWGRRPTILVSFATMTAATGLLALVTAPAGIAVMVVLLGLFAGLYRPAAQALIADVVPGEGRVRAFSLMYWAGNIGFSIAALSGGFIASRSFTALFLADAGTCLVGGLVLWAGLRKVPSAPGGGAGAPSPGEPAASAPSARPTRLYWGFLALMLAFIAIQSQPWTAVPLVATARGLSPADWGLITAVNGITVVAMQLPAAKLVERWDLGKALAAASVLVAVGFTMVAWIWTVPLFMLHTAVWSLGEVLFFAAAPALASRMAPDHARGRWMGLFSATFALGTLIAPASGGWALGVLPGNTLWYVCGIVALAAAVGQQALRARYRAALAVAEGTS